MTLDLANYEKHAKQAIKAFWGNRSAASKLQKKRGTLDQGSRGSVTAGKNMDGFLVLLRDLVVANGLPKESIHVKKRVVTLPGYFRPTKQWDFVVVHDHRLVAAIELKSQVGSYGNNFNNRSEEAIGSAHDFWTAYREGAFGKCPPPFLGWIMLVADAPKANKPVKSPEPHFPVDPAFADASYAQRYHVLCQRLIEEKLYNAACLMLSPETAKSSGKYREVDTLTSLRQFCVRFAGCVAERAVRSD